MNSKSIFEQALHIETPWYVREVVLHPGEKTEVGELHLYLDFESGGKFKDTSGEYCGVYDTTERTWQHLNFFEHRCYIHARVPRVRSSDGKVTQVVVPWARAGSGFTLLFEAYAMMLIEYEMPVNKVASSLRVVAHRVWRVFHHWVDKAVKKDRLEDVEHIGIDETSVKKGHQYITVCADLESRRVIHVGAGRGAEAIHDVVTSLRSRGGDSEQIKNVAIDMSPSYISGVQEYLPKAKITFDKFHIVVLLNKAIDEVRKAERKHYRELRGHKYTFLRRYSSMSSEQQYELDVLLEAYPRLGEAYRLREIFYEFWELDNPEQAENFLLYWRDMVFDTDIEPLKKFANTIVGHLSGIVNYIHSQITSGLMEGLNNKIQLAKRRARGYRNSKNFINMIYFIAGKLQFHYPHYPS
jgi:transposase